MILYDTSWEMELWMNWWRNFLRIILSGANFWKEKAISGKAYIGELFSLSKLRTFSFNHKFSWPHSSVLSVFFLQFRLPYLKQEAQQYKILYIGLYLLIWGEAANLRFMPECLCYIFHHVSWVSLPFLGLIFCTYV